MRLNVKKCNLVRFTTKRSPFPSLYRIGVSPVSVVPSVKYLGVYFTETLTWNKHVQFTISKANRLLGFLKRNFKDCPQEVKKTLYLTNVRSILEYGCAVWDPHQLSLQHELEKIQNRAARFITKKYGRSYSVTKIKSNIGLIPLADRRKNLRLKLFHNIYYNNTGIDKNKYLFPPHFVSYRRDHVKKVREPLCKTDIFQHSFFPFCISSWNKLPVNIVVNPSNISFVQTLDTVLYT